MASTSTWTPPPCYYAPAYSPAQLQKKLEPIWEAGSTGHEWDLSQRHRYVNGEPYKDFNKKTAGEGYWWDSFIPDGKESARIGEAYAKGKADETPSCGVKYLRSSGDGAYALKATVTWKINWTGTGVNGQQKLPDGQFGADQDVIVQEIQSINR
ncbi:hypothetical protein GCM10009837_53730 [Streptomyces durmitorensis]|uniref:Uncharacterized protein n=1 Tax=Streptomyces durmitorensis TaxID=319947 RepID=A0ABY4PWM2_9ACTN|nr:hypothetical protein [Streptomyces durmitorensis]UQT58260.1 hypothetical protein M4V62_26020 [Streptomyces durmitorensis]